MRFGVAAPGYRNPIEDMAFNLFAMSVEEKREKIEEVIRLMSMATDPNDSGTQENIFLVVGLSPDSLTRDEVKYIENEVARRWPITST